MEVGFKHQKANKPEPVRIEQVFAEKPGGGLVANPDFDVPPTSAVALDPSTGLYKPIKAYKLVASVEAADTTIKIAKGSGVAKNDIIGHGKIAVKCTAVNSTNEDYDVVTVSLGVAIDITTEDPWLFQAKAISVAAVEGVAYGYYDADSETEGAVKVVASGASTGEINLASVTPYKGSKNLAANDYVILKDQVEAVEGVDAEPLYKPEYITGKTDWVYAGEGDQSVKLINGANVRKETANISEEIAALLPTIKRV